MIVNEQAQNPLNPESFQVNLPSWDKFFLRTFKKGVSCSAGVIMGHYLIVLAQDKSLNPLERDDYYDETDDELACLLAFDLDKKTVQEAWIDKNLFKFQKDYSFLKYGENQIIKYGGDFMSDSPSSLCFITIKSFEPFMVKCEDIKNPNRGRFSRHTAQIYKDHLYIYGKAEKGWTYKGPTQYELWSFDLKNREWKLCETTGESPGESEIMAHSFIFQESLYLYGGITYENRFSGDLFVLNFNSMKWTKVQQPENYLCSVDNCFGLKCGGTVDKENLILLKNSINSRENTLCVLDLHAQNIWSTSDIKGINEYHMDSEVITGGLMTYKKFLLVLFCAEINDKNLQVAIIDLEHCEIPAPKSAVEEEYFSSLFMSETDSDIAFKVEGKVFPAHKRILMKKSQYFEKLFKSGMAESKQDVIEIKDCESADVFQEYFRFIYQDKVNLDVSLAFRLYSLADKYVQNDLCKKCLLFLRGQINFESIYAILDFAFKENIPMLKNSCLKFFLENLSFKKKDLYTVGYLDRQSIENVVELINYLDRQEDLEFKEDHKDFRNCAFNFLLEHFFEIHRIEGVNMNFYENFLIKNIALETISALALFLDRSDEWPEDKKAIFERFLKELREEAFGFVQENITRSNIGKYLSSNFLKDFTIYMSEKLDKLQKERIQIESGKKRMEPTKNSDIEDENSGMKKTKKFDPNDEK